MEPAIEISNLRFGYGTDDDVLDIPGFHVGRSESVFLHGASGSGKSTLLSLIGGVTVPRAGEVVVLGRSFGDMKNAKRDRVRADHIGFIFQQFNLLPYLSVDENVALPCRYSRRRKQRAIEADETVAAATSRLLGDLGIDGRLRGRKSTDLSVGQQQRVGRCSRVDRPPGTGNRRRTNVRTRHRSQTRVYRSAVG